MKFSFIIPSIKQYEMLFNGCIDSLVKFHGGEDYEIIIVEDGSEKQLQDRIVKEAERRGNIKVVINETNIGFPRSVNRGLEAASGDYLVLTNNDIVFTQNVLRPFEAAFDKDPKIGIVGSLLFYPHGTIQHGGIITLGQGHFTHRGWHKTLGQAPEVHKADYLIAVTGALFTLRRKAMEEIGPMNAEYFLACDDTEYCLRAWTKDWRVFYSPDIRAIHAEGATRGANDRDKLIKGRHWFIKERETFGKFQNDVLKYDWKIILDKVVFANREAVESVQATKPTTQPNVGRVEYKGAARVESKMGARKTIGVRRTGALGDVLLATGAIRKLKEQNPDFDIVVATVCPDVFKNSPRVMGTVRTIEGLPACEKIYDLDMAYENSPKQLVSAAYAKTIFGHDNLDLIPELFSTEQDYATIKQKLGSFDPQKDKIAVLHMSVGWPSRTWTREKWGKIVRSLVEKGFKVVILGRGADHRADPGNGVLNLVDYASIHEARELMRRASVFVGIDSGMLHVAMTTDIPAVGIFTVANPDFRISKRPNATTIALVPKVECRYCLHEQAPPVTFVACKFGTNHCLDDISIEETVNAAVEVAR